MNKTQIKEAIEVKRNKQLRELRENHDIVQDTLETIYIEEMVSKELKAAEESLYSLRNNREFKTFVSNMSALTEKVEETDNIRCMTLYAQGEFKNYCRQILDGSFDYKVQSNVNSYSGEARKRKAYEQYKDKQREINTEYNKLQAYLKSTTAKKFMEYMNELGIDIEITKLIVMGKKQLPAPNFNIDILKGVT